MEKLLNSPLYDLMNAIRHLTYDDMMSFAEHIGSETGALGANWTGMSGDELSADEIANAVRSFADRMPLEAQ